MRQETSYGQSFKQDVWKERGFNAVKRETIEELVKSDCNYINTTMRVEAIKDFTVKSLLEYGSPEAFYEAEKVINVMLEMFRKLHQINEETYQVWVDVLISAAYIHNLFYDGTLGGIFAAREKLMSLAKKCEVPVNAAAGIFQAVEGQLGMDMPVEACQVHGDTPNGIFAWACWFVEEFNGTKILPECVAW